MHCTSRDFLIVPMPPTPNGRLHLGHLAGPYLRADILARHLEREGHKVSVITGTDAYESWVLLDCSKPPNESSTIYHDKIREDLQQIDIIPTQFILPLDKEHSAAYGRIHEHLLLELINNGTAHLLKEPIPVSSESGRIVVGPWLLGRCPKCKEKSGGNACESCGYHYQPSQILDPHSRLSEGDLHWEERESWFARPTDLARLVSSLSAMQVDPLIKEAALDYLKNNGAAVRLSMPGSWGIRSDLVGEDQVLSNTFFAYALYCGHLFAKNGDYKNPFSIDSSVSTLCLFGIDNAVAATVGPSSIAQCSGTKKSFDYYLSNHFLTLESQKFSTSRGHGIWAHDLFRTTNITSDELRYLLSSVSPEKEARDLKIHFVAERINGLRKVINDRVNPAIRQGNKTDEINTKWITTKLCDAVKAQSALISPERLEVSGAVAVLDGWLQHPDVVDSPGVARAWLVGIAILAWPIMPQMSAQIWMGLGGCGTPSLPNSVSLPSLSCPELETPTPLQECTIFAAARTSAL